MTLVIDKELGRGKFGITFLATYNGQQVAAKTPLGSVVSSLTPAIIADMNREILNLQKLKEGGSNKYVTTYIGADVFNTKQGSRFYILSEYVSGASLEDVLISMSVEGQKIKPFTLWPLMLQLMKGLQFIHDQNIAHRDIKPANIMLTTDYTVKYIDFGLACLKNCSSCEDKCANSIGGTPLYSPPEYFIMNRPAGLLEEKAHDIWSLGVTFYEMTNGYLNYPFNEADINNRIPISYVKPSGYTLDDDRTNKFIADLLVINWQGRPTIDDALRIFSENISERPWVYTIDQFA